MPQVDLPDNIFRAYDIRGKLGEEITPERIQRIARTFAQLFLGPGAKVVLGRDLRASSEELADAAREGLVAAGAQVWDIGVVPTPLSYFIMGRWQADGGVMITASHNPPEYNGMKVRVGDRPFYGESLKELRDAARQAPEPVGGGTVVERDPYPEYFETLMKHVSLARPLHVVLDLGNGAGALTAIKVLGDLGCKLDLLFPEADGGQFLGRGPNPMIEGALDALAARVKEVGAEVGLALDADGDRLAVVDEKGRVITPDRAVLPLARHFMDRGRGVFVADVRCTRSMIEYVESYGRKGAGLADARVELSPCGYPFVLKTMAKHKAVFGFETTGHYFFDNPDIKYDDATFSAALLCQVLSAGEERIGDLVAAAPVYYTAEEVRWKCDDKLKFQVVEKLRAEYEQLYDVVTIDGVRVERPEGWALVRASNTAPELTMRWEGATEQARDEIGDELLARVKRVMEEVGA
ncbi:MAG: phosphomannomutase/phosphoglucomutase [Armatimonadetes bacterium]|nr:phosphomannomutase/phosphoglucomutase [Armatimonadota bacterium]